MEIEKKIGRNHYQNLTFEPMELDLACGYPFTAVSVFKYLARYKYKNGIDDLRKALHMAKCMQEADFHLSIFRKAGTDAFLIKFKNTNGFCRDMRILIYNIHGVIFMLRKKEDRNYCYKVIIRKINELIKEEENELMEITIKK